MTEAKRSRYRRAIKALFDEIADPELLEKSYDDFFALNIALQRHWDQYNLVHDEICESIHDDVDAENVQDQEFDEVQTMYLKLVAFYNAQIRKKQTENSTNEKVFVAAAIHTPPSETNECRKCW